MASIVVQVGGVQSNYQNKFTYTIDASFNGIEGAIHSAQIQDFIPDTIAFTLPRVQAPMKGITTEPVAGGTLIRFDFGEMVDLGVAITLELGCQFKLVAQEGESFVNAPELWINGQLHKSSIADAVTLTLQPDFKIKHEKVLPIIAPTPGGSMIVAVELTNEGDLGVQMTDVEMNITLPEACLFDATFPIRGKDLSSAPFEDTSQDGVVGQIQGNVLSFTLPHYRGAKYQFFYKVLIDTSSLIGQTITHALSWSIGGVSQQDADYSIVLAQASEHGVVQKYGADYTLPGRYINYELYVINDGNTELNQVTLTDSLPVQVRFYKLHTGTFYVGGIKTYIGMTYRIDYTTANGLTGTLGTFNTDSETVIDLETLGIPATDRLASFIWHMEHLGIGVTQASAPKMDGIVLDGTAIGSSLLNHFSLGWQTGGSTQSSISNKVTIVQDLCVCQPIFNEISPQTSVKPGDIVRYSIGASCWQSRLKNPVLAIVLPPQLQYVGNVSTSYTDYFGGAPVPGTPDAQVIPSFAGSGQTVVKFRYDGQNSFEFRQRASLSISFDTKVRIGATGEIHTSMLLGNSMATQVIPNNLAIYQDTHDLAENGSAYQLYAQSRTLSQSILFFTSIASNKKVKGALDTDYSEEPLVGKTYEGGGVRYLLELTNTGNVDLESIEIVDILPHRGDTGVIEIGSQRNSAFEVYNINQITASISPVGGSTPLIGIWYGKSYDPVRFGDSFQMIGSVNDWSQTLPEVATDVRSIKVTLQGTKFVPGQMLTIGVHALVPVGALSNQVAWNSFAAKVSYKDRSGILKYLLPVESEKVGIEVQEISADRRKITGIIWSDDGDGIYTQEEGGIDDILVLLYDCNGRLVEATVTAPDMQGRSGYYMFNNLPTEKYFIRAVIEELKYRFTAQKLSVLHGSKVDQRTGVTPVIDLEAVAVGVRIDIGLIRLTPDDRVELALQMNQSAKKVMRGAIYNQMLLSTKLEDTKSLIEMYTSKK